MKAENARILEATRDYGSVNDSKIQSNAVNISQLPHPPLMLQNRICGRERIGTQARAEDAQMSLENKRVKNVDKTGLMTSSTTSFNGLQMELETSKKGHSRPLL